MISLKFALAVIFLSQAVFSAPSKPPNPCVHLQCDGPLLPCIQYLPTNQTYICACTIKCNDLQIIDVPVVETLADKMPTTAQPATRPPQVPMAKQGGTSCYQSACMNGGTCFSSLVTQTTTAAPINRPICACQAQFSGSRCELYTPSNNYDGWNNICRVYNEKNLNICQNGGQCVFIADGKVACVCPSTFSGQFCELPVYIQCSFSTLCHRDYGVCDLNGACQCKTGYTGPKCDIPASTVTASPLCPANYCLNAGICRQTTVDPYVSCICQPNYTGSRCELMISPLITTSTTTSTTSTTTTTTTTLAPRCNFTIGLQNDGLYTARFRVQYTIDGIQQPIIYSNSLPFIGQTAYVTIPNYAKNVMVSLDRLGFYWDMITADSNIDYQIATKCTKCYKTWGVVSDPKWDFIIC